MQKAILLLLFFCLLLTACHGTNHPISLPEAEDPVPPVAEPIPPAVFPADSQPDPQPVYLDQLTIEIVVDWSEADRILSQINDLSRLLGEALAEKGCTMENPVTVTIGTAGGITAQALADGGVDAAILPTSNYTEIETQASAILHSTDNSTTTAVSLSRAELDENFRTIFASALLETDAGEDFLQICYPDATFAGMNEQIFYFNP